MNIDHQHHLPLDPAARGAQCCPWLPRAGFSLAALFALAFVALCGYAAYQIHLLPDSFGRALNPTAWDVPFRKQAIASRGALIAIALALCCIAIARWDRTVALMKSVWLGIGHPMNLAIYRIVLFATILFNLDNDNGRTQIVYFAGLPKALFVPPTGMEHLLAAEWFRDLINPTVAGWALTLMNVFCVTAILGFFTRTSAWLVLAFGVFATGIPQYFGQTNHFHHMFWFAAILACSRCGDHLSVDALFAARRRANAGSTEPPAPAWAYALPLRFIWVLLGICYFFPGLWKYWASGLGWAFSDHFKHLAEWKWINMGLQMKDGQWQGDWKPLFRIDLYPWMYKPAAMTALVFEFSFMVLIFFPRLKYVAIAMGVGFHRMIALTMRIPFYTLQTSYVSLIEWDRFFAWIGRKRKWEMMFAYDGQNASARRSVAMLRAIDLMGNVTYRDDASPAVGAETTVKGKTLTGAAALRALAARNPVLWVVWPLVYLLPDPTKTTAQRSVVTSSRPAWTPPAIWPVALGAAIVLTPNLYLGLKAQYHAWPFSCYPLFEKIRIHEKADFDVVALDAGGQPIVWDEKHMMDIMTRPRYATMCRKVLEAGDKAKKTGNPKDVAYAEGKLHAFWDMLVGQNPQLKDAKTVQFWNRTRLSAPEQFTTAKPVREDLVHQAQLTAGGIVPDARVTSLRSQDAEE